MIGMRVTVVGERRSYADLGEMSTVGLFTGFESDRVESLEFLLIRGADDRSVRWGEDDLTDTDLGEFLDDEFGFVSTVRERDERNYRFLILNVGFFFFYYLCCECFFVDIGDLHLISN